VEVVRRGVRGLYKTGITRMAAALAYRTIFSMIPMLAIGLLIFGSVVSEERVETGVRRMLEFAGVSQITVNSAPVEETMPEGIEGPVGAGRPVSVEEVEKAQTAAEIEEIISDLVVRVNNTLGNLPTGWIALVTGLVLLYAAMSMIIEVEKSFNQVCAAPGGRSWIKRLVLYWTMLSAGGLLLIATFWAGDALASFVRGSGGSAIRSSLAGYGVSVLISTALLLIAYLVIPNVRLKLRPVLAGAFMAAVCWELGKWGFTGYLRYSTGYAQFYGSLALLPLFLLWIYVTWVIVLLGLQAAYALQHFSRLVASGNGSDRDGPRLVDPAIAIAVMSNLVRCHGRGLTPDAGEIGEAIGTDASVVDALIRRLERAGLVRRVSGSDGEDGWLPGKPGDKIGVDEVLDAVGEFDAARRGGDEDGGLLLGVLSRARREAAKGRTIAPSPPRGTDG
jgi:membrane protein